MSLVGDSGSRSGPWLEEAESKEDSLFWAGLNSGPCQPDSGKKPIGWLPSRVD